VQQCGPYSLIGAQFALRYLSVRRQFSS
jgi:acyl-CoA oxidase